MTDHFRNSEHRPTVSFVTLGCRVNQYESDAIGEALVSRGFRLARQGEPAELYIINTCTVTAESDRKSRQMIRRAAALPHHPKVIVTGCYAELAMDEAKHIPGVTAVFGNRDKSAIAEYATSLFVGTVPQKLTSLDPYRIFDLKISRSLRARSYIKIEDGCDNKCTYCTISKARGSVVSRSPAEIIREAERLISSGCREVILTGIECAKYGRDIPDNADLASLILDIDKLPGIKRIGLGSLEPSYLKPGFLQKLREARHLLPHFHLSIQSGSTSVLNRMKRKYSRETALKVVSDIRHIFPEAMLSADVIVGFPGESEQDFADTVDFCRKSEFLHLHVFQYSRRKGTVAYEMPDQIPEDIKRYRSEELIKVGNEVRDLILDRYCREHSNDPAFLNVEELDRGFILGHTEHYVPVSIPVADADIPPSPGDILPVYTLSHVGSTVTCMLRPIGSL